jgi:hypothetical protein
MIALLSFVGFPLFWAAANRYAGMEKGNRYVGPAIFALAGYPLTGSIEGATAAVVLSLSYLLWRSWGWQGSMDMGKDEGKFSSEFITFSLICCLLSLPATILFGNFMFFLIIQLFVPGTYALVMRKLPNKPGIRHIAVAETLSGVVIGLGAFILLKEYI